jgi:hypothetical protein
MNKASRFALFFFILGLILFLGLVFSGWVLPNIIQPAVEAVWLFLRIFILSVDQEYYWYLLSIAGFMWLIYRFTHRATPVIPAENILRNETLSNLNSWQKALILSKHDGSERSVARRKIFKLLISHYEARQQNSTQLEIRQALEQRQLPLPDSVYIFLFPPEPQAPRRPSLHAVYQVFLLWYHQITGQEDVEFNQMIDELIDFMEH